MCFLGKCGGAVHSGAHARCTLNTAAILHSQIFTLRGVKGAGVLAVLRPSGEAVF
jgi:hypothetical protein